MVAQLGELAAEWVDIDSIHPWKRNPRKITDRAIEKVAESIRRFGFASPIICRREDREIIAGHTRHLAAKKLELIRVPVRFMDLDPADAQLLAIADNRTGEETDWDEEALAELLKEHRDSGADLSTLGFDTFELADTFKGDGDSLDLGAPRTTRPVETESFRFRAFKISIAKELAEQFEAAIKRYAEDRGTTNGFVEHMLCALDAAERDAEPDEGAA